MSLLSLLEAALAVTVAVNLAVAQAPATASISGVVKNATTGLPVANLTVQIGALTSNTDAAGRYVIRNVPGGRHRVTAGTSRRGPSGVRVVSIGTGQEISSFDFDVHPNGTVSGKIIDHNDEPIPDLEVVLIGREYHAGALRYYREKAVRTNDLGQYRVEEAPPGRSYLILARRPSYNLKPISEVAANPSLRRLTLAAAYYPGSTTPEAAGIVSVQAGQTLEGLDFRLLRLPSYCIESVLRLEDRPVALSFWIHEKHMPFNTGANGGTTGFPPYGQSGPDGKIRICDLYPGDYRLTVYSGDANSPHFFGSTDVTVSDRDVKGVTVVPQLRVPLSGRVVWAEEPSVKPVDSTILVLLSALRRSFGIGGAAASIPGEFSVKVSLGGEDLVMDEYHVGIRGLPSVLYLKDLTYGSTNLLRSGLQLGSAMAGAELRVVIGRDGGFLTAKVADSEGKAVPDTNVVLIPDSIGSYADLAAMRIVGRSDQNGEYASSALAPGRYHVIATTSPVDDFSPETIGKLWLARAKAKEVTLRPGATARETIEFRPLN